MFRRLSSAPTVIATIAAAALLAACGGSGGQDVAAGELPSTLHVGIVPNIAPDDQRAKYDPLRVYLEKELGTDVELFVATNYAGVVAALTAKQIDVAYVGGLTYVQAKEQSDVTPLVTEVDRETGTTKYLSAIVVAKDSPMQSVKDVVAAKGTFAFGDVSSTSGSLYPRIMLDEAGAQCSPSSIESCPPLREVTFTGGHDATAKAVAQGSVDAGGLELRILHKLQKDGTIAPDAVRVVGTKEVVGYPWVGRTALGQENLSKIRDAFLHITDPTLLDLLRAKSYQAVTDADYAEIRDQATRLGLLTSQ